MRLSIDASGVGKAVWTGDHAAYAGTATDVPGIGDGAFEFASSATQVTLDFYKGSTMVTITLDTASPSGPPKQQVLALATTAAGRV